MNTVLYASPLVPVEWLAAHGVRPIWWRACDPRSACATDRDVDRRGEPSGIGSPLRGRRGVCPLAAAVVDSAVRASASAVVLTTTCDQMRYAASWLQYQRRLPTFLMNVPSTWETESARSLYLAELVRLSRLLVTLGGTRPSNEALAEVMRGFDGARARLLGIRDRLSGRDLAAALIAVRETAEPNGWPDAADSIPSSKCPLHQEPAQGGPLRLAMVGGPLSESDYGLFDWIEQAGGRIVLDATEWGERTLPRVFSADSTRRDPLRELADAYFGTIPEVFRRPNHTLYEYLSRELSARHVHGLILRRYLWCDLWHAEVAVLKACSPVPVLDLDASDSESSSSERTRGRIEAFLEMLP
jgi:benzoyl-CoA reductase/2-hydroxyglutaryl-CoA dehydratase subunit BcrC/BadD/HgdB